MCCHPAPVTSGPFCAMVLLSTVFGRSPHMAGPAGWAVCDSRALNEPLPTLCSCWLFTLTLDCRPCDGTRGPNPLVSWGGDNRPAPWPAPSLPKSQSSTLWQDGQTTQFSCWPPGPWARVTTRQPPVPGPQQLLCKVTSVSLLGHQTLPHLPSLQKPGLRLTDWKHPQPVQVQG